MRPRWTRINYCCSKQACSRNPAQGGELRLVHPYQPHSSNYSVQVAFAIPKKPKRTPKRTPPRDPVRLRSVDQRGLTTVVSTHRTTTPPLR